MKDYSSTISSIVLCAMCSLLCFISFFTLQGNEGSFNDFFAEIGPQAKIEYFQEECRQITCGEIKSQEYIAKLPKHERYIFEIKLKKAKKIFQILREVVNLLKDNQLSNNQKLKLIESLVALHGKILAQKTFDFTTGHENIY